MTFIRRFTHAASAFLKANPSKDWFLILTLLTAFLIIEVIYAGYLYYGIRSGGVVGVAEQVQEAPLAISVETLEKTVEFFRTRKINFEARTFSLPVLTNPGE